jgi:hypothetical protein
LEYDYYKLLGLPIGSDAATVRRAYLDQAKKHHPDIRPNDKESEEFMKILNQGYDILSNPDKKSLYDNLLYNHYQRKESAPKKKSTTRTDYEKRSSMARERQQRKDEQFVVHFMQRRRIFQYQIIVFIMLLIGCPVYAWNNWYVDFDSFDHVRLLLCGFLFIIAAVRLAVLAYRFVSVHNIVNPRHSRSDGWIFGSLFITVIAAPVALFPLGELRLEYHFKHYLKKTPAVVVRAHHTDITYTFTAGNRVLTKRQDLDIQFLQALKDGELIVYYSEKDPRIARIQSYNLNTNWK